MNSNLLVIDDFYENPDEVRAFALTQPFNVSGVYPGPRTACNTTDECKDAIAAILFPHGGKITNFGDYADSPVYSGGFQLSLPTSVKQWIHADTFNNWAGILYLNPDAPLSSGTKFYRHKATKELKCPHRVDPQEVSNLRVEEGKMHGEDAYDWTKWELVNSVGNVYNRLVLFRPIQYHTSGDFFGTTLEDGRLTQIFFLSTEY